MCYIHCKPLKQCVKSAMGKTIALLVSIFIIVTFFLSTAFIITHANHEHDHEGPNGTCATCFHLEATEKILKQLSTATGAGIFTVALCLFISYCLKLSAPYRGLVTLIALKVRLNN